MWVNLGENRTAPVEISGSEVEGVKIGEERIESALVQVAGDLPTKHVDPI